MIQNSTNSFIPNIDIANIEAAYRALGDSAAEKNPIKAVHQGFQKFKEIQDFVENSRSSYVLCGSETPIEFQSLERIHRMAADILFVKSIGTINLNKDNFEEVYSEKADTNEFISANTRCIRLFSHQKRDLFSPQKAITNVIESLKTLVLGIDQQFQKGMDLSDDIERQLLTTNHQGISRFERSQFEVYASLGSNPKQGKDWIWKEASRLTKPENMSEDEFKNDVLEPREKLISYVERLEAFSNAIELNGFGFSEGPTNGMQSPKEYAWLRNPPQQKPLSDIAAAQSSSEDEPNALKRKKEEDNSPASADEITTKKLKEE